MRMTSRGLGVVFAIVAGCSADGGPGSTGGAPSPSTPAGTAIDGSWARMGFAAGRFANLGGPNQFLPDPLGRPASSPPPDQALDWQFMLDAPTSVTPALWVAGATMNNATDRMYAYGVISGTSYLGAADNLYCTDPTLSCPNVAWYLPMDSAIDGSSIALAPDGTRAYAVSSNGTVYGVDTASGALASGWPVSIGAKVSWASPWLDFTATPYQLYVADTSGHVSRIDTSTATVVWRSAALCRAIHSSPLVWNSVVWVGCDDGYLHRLDPATGNEYPPATKLCASSTCGTNDAIYSGPFVDIADNRLVLGVNNRVINVDISPTTGCTTGPVSCTFESMTIGSSAIYHSTPFIDVTGGFVYASFNNKLWRARWSGTQITTPFVASATPLKGVNKDLGYPKSTPMVFNGHIWIGDGGGYVNRYSSSNFALENVTPRYGVTIDTTPVIDVAGGNIYYGTNGAGNATMTVDSKAGSWVQLAQTW